MGLEAKRIKEERVRHSFMVHVYRLEIDGKYNENGIETEHTRTIPTFAWSNLDYSGAYNHAVRISEGRGFFPKEEYYFGHWAE